MAITTMIMVIMGTMGTTAITAITTMTMTMTKTGNPVQVPIINVHPHRSIVVCISCPP